MIRQPNDPFAEALAREARVLTPAFSAALHARMMSAVQDAPSAETYPIRPRISYFRPLAAAALLGLVVSVAWKANHVAARPLEVTELAASLRDATAPLRDTVIDRLQTPTRTTDALANDAQRFGKFLANQFDFLDVENANRG